MDRVLVVKRGLRGLDGNDPPDNRPLAEDVSEAACFETLKLLGRRPFADATDGGASFFVGGAVDTKANNLAAFRGILSDLFELLDGVMVVFDTGLLDCVFKGTFEALAGAFFAD